MSELKSIEKLREWAQKFGPMGSHDPLMFADEIEAEVAESYMRIPCDADGVPIRVGDKLMFDMNDPGICTGYDWLESVGKWMIVVRRDWNSGCMFLAHDRAHHVQRTLEDVLRDFYFESKNECDTNQGDLYGELIPKCAAEIRELLEVKECKSKS